ncbi:MAG: hypothetical protein JXR65_06505 [Bacteroidales bacterium]|nr:hypothetical protein [Bacteroidales bacterium]
MLIRIKSVIGFFIVVLLFSACQNRQKENALFDASVLTNSDNPEEIIDIIGEKPDTAFNRLIVGKPRYILMYNNLDSTEFRFAHNKLTEVIVHKPDFPFVDSTLIRFGLPFRRHTQVDTAAYVMWKNVYKNFEVVNFYLVGSRKDERSARYKIYFKLKQ